MRLLVTVLAGALSASSALAGPDPTTTSTPTPTPSAQRRGSSIIQNIRAREQATPKPTRAAEGDKPSQERRVASPTATPVRE